MENKIKRQFTEAPPYRIVRKGLNLEAVCKNKKCEAFDKKAWVQKGFGKFNIAKEVHKCKCPLCGQGTQKAVNIGYFETAIIVEGKIKNGELIDWKEKVTERELTTFCQGKE